MGGVACALVACSLLVDVPDVTLSPSDEAGSSRCARTPDGGLRKGTPMVEVVVDDQKSFCIDTTEVTVAQFNAFLLDGGSYQGAPAPCATARGLPLVENDPALQDHPQGSVGACPAWAYCRWAGKRLCGSIADGGSVHTASSPNENEWVFACVNGKRNTAFPYGVANDASACNVKTGASVPVGSKPDCRGIEAPFDRIYDMTGNVQEVTNEFEEGNDTFGFRGGSFASSAGACDTQEGANGFLFYFEQVGFRCCADAPPRK